MMAKNDGYLNPLCLPSTLDSYPSRRGVLLAVLEQVDNFHGTLLDIGCGKMPYKSILLHPNSSVVEYIGLDLPDSGYGKPDLEWDGCNIPLENESVHCAMATEVFEHCPDPELVMRETVRVLKPGGMLFFTVPFFWPLHNSPHDEYRFTPFSLERHLSSAGFGQIKMKSLGGWDASLAQMIGLWVRRRPMSKGRRRIFSILATPILRYLIRNDKPPEVHTDRTMITEIAGTAIKVPTTDTVHNPPVSEERTGSHESIR